MIDHDALDWENVVGATYSISQRFCYRYPGPIYDLAHRLVVFPRAVHADQRRLTRSLSVAPDAPSVAGGDDFGNDVVTIAAGRIENVFEVSIESTVRRERSAGDHVVSCADLTYPGYRTMRVLTNAERELSEVARWLRSMYRHDRDLAEAIVAFVHAEIIYTKGVTAVETTAAQAFGLRRGVCQDFAHIALALARSCGLAARYVSGHLLGEGATHAWIEFLLPNEVGDGVSLSYDPTYGGRTTIRYVVVAVGRDYQDVAPTSGVFTAPYTGVLECRTRVGVADVTYRSA